MFDDQVQESLPLGDESAGNLPVEPADGTTDMGSEEERNAPPEGDPRWNKIYARMKEHERKYQDAEARLSERDTILEEMRRQNAILQQMVQQAAPKQADPLDTVRAEYEAATEAENWREAVRLNGIIAKEEAKREMAAQIQQTQAQQQQAQPVGLPPDDQVAVGIFKQQNPAFFDNKYRNTLLLTAADEVNQDPRWKSRPMADRLNEAARRANGVLSPNLKPSLGDGVGGGNNMSKTPATLTPDEIKVARMMFPESQSPEKEYLESKLAISRRR